VNDFLHAAWPVAVALLAIALVWAIPRYLFARRCWRCGVRFGFLEPARPLFGKIPRAYCRRCGSRSIRLW